MADHVDQQLGNYRIIRLLGSGAFADVYLGEHIYLKSHAAIKILRAQIQQKEIDSFLKEAQIIARLIHPHIVRVLDFGVEGKIPFLVMDYVPNGSLRNHYPKGTRLPLLIVISYIKQIASALQQAHNVKPEPIVHRDVKPENMLLGQNDEVLLSDFGIATIAATYLQRQQDVAGTLPYMAPEQIQGKPRRASDQYSLGIVTYEWLTGEWPFQGTPQEIYIQHCTVPPPPLHEKVPTILPNVEQAVLKALAKNADDRFPNVMAFAEALEKASALPGESYYSEHVAHAMRECYYQWCDKADWGEMKEITADDAKQLQHLRSGRQVTIGYKRPFTRGAIYWSDRAKAQPIWGGFNGIHNNEKGVEGILGFPLTGELSAAHLHKEQKGYFSGLKGNGIILKMSIRILFGVVHHYTVVGMVLIQRGEG
jgi:serine/threonine protein kinase